MNNLGQFLNSVSYKIQHLSPGVEECWQYIAIEKLTGMKGLKLITLRKEYWHLQGHDSKEQEPWR